MQRSPPSAGWHTRLVPLIKMLTVLSVGFVAWNMSTTTQLIHSENLTLQAERQQGTAMFHNAASNIPAAQQSEPSSGLPSNLSSEISSGVSRNSRTSEILNEMYSELPSEMSSELSSQPGSGIAAAQNFELPAGLLNGLPSEESGGAGSGTFAASKSEMPSELSSELPSELLSDVGRSSQKSEMSSDAGSSIRGAEKSELLSELPSEAPAELPSELPSEMPGILPSDVDSNIPVAQESRKPLWFQSEKYRDESGCDFSEIVAQFKPDELEINCDNIGQLETGEFIGSGLWRKAYKATWNGRDVVVKRVSDYGLSQPNVMYRHVKEAAAIFLIHNDANIVGLVGWCNLTIVLEYIPTNLDILLHGTRDLVSVKRTLELARDAARGLVQVHNMPEGPLVHGDIKCEQFLLGDDGVLRLNDFNYVMYAGPRIVNGTVTSEKCPFHFPVAPKSRWHSPEEINHLPLDEKIDIYGLSIVMWAMKSRRRPYQAIDMDEAWEGIPKGLRPPVSEMNDYPQAMQDLIIRGWDHDPKKRPTAMEMAEEIDRILQQYKEE